MDASLESLRNPIIAGLFAGFVTLVAKILDYKIRSKELKTNDIVKHVLFGMILVSLIVYLGGTEQMVEEILNDPFN